MVGWVSSPLDHVSSRLHIIVSPAGRVRGGGGGDGQPGWLHQINKSIKTASWRACNRAITYTQCFPAPSCLALSAVH